ncbi:MAG: nuclear transport factor 2 family protein [Steroidobacteraceae bacterium]
MNRRDWLMAAPAVAAFAGSDAAMGATSTQANNGAHFERVKAVIMGWRRKDLSAVLDLCADDIVWYSHVGSPPIVGKPAMASFMEKLSGQMQVVRWRIFHYAENGDVVFSEGVDDFTSPDGKEVAIPYAGVFRFRDGKIVEWRDYFDRASFDRFKAGEVPAEHMSALMKREALF